MMSNVYNSAVASLPLSYQGQQDSVGPILCGTRNFIYHCELYGLIHRNKRAANTLVFQSQQKASCDDPKTRHLVPSSTYLLCYVVCMFLPS